MTPRGVALGLDVGSGGARAALVDADGRTLAALSGAPRSDAWWTKMTAEDLFAEGAAVARRLVTGLSTPAIVRSVGVGALGPTPVPVDRELRSLFPLSPYSLEPVLPAGGRRRRHRIGMDDPSPKLRRWREQEPGKWRRVAWVVDLTGYVVGRLTGRPVMDAVTAADYRRAARDGVPLPAILDPLAVVGGLGRDGAAALGLSAGIPVVAGTYDSYIDLFGAGVRRPGERGAVLGSTLVLGRAIDVSEEPIRTDPGLRIVGYLEGRRLLVGWTAAAGLTLDWARGRLGFDQTAPTLAEDLSRLAPGEAGLLALPYLSGERSPVWDPWARGAVVGLGLGTTRLELYRAFLDAVGLSTLDLADRLGDGSAAGRPWRVTGGGARDAAWLDATVDALGARVETVAASPGSAAAAVAWRGIDVDVQLPVDRGLDPDPDRHERYRRALPLYRELYRRLRPLMRTLATWPRSCGSERGTP